MDNMRYKPLVDSNISLEVILQYLMVGMNLVIKQLSVVGTCL